MRIESGAHLVKTLITLVLLPVTLAACASLAGSPQRVIDVTKSVALAEQYEVVQALRAFEDLPDSKGPDDSVADLRHGLTREQYRNMVITVYLNAADARYHDWRSRVSDERRELGTGFDSAVIALTGAASVARQSFVRSLSAAASIMAGTRGTIDRNIYFDRALPGLLASMDSRRLRIRTEIVRRFADTAADYPLATAFADISGYESAASLDGAIEDITAQAAEERRDAQLEYNSAIHACHATEDLTANRRTIIAWVRAPPPARSLEQLQGLAGLMGLSTEGGTAALPSRIHGAVLANYCSNAALQSLIASARQRSWGSGL